MQLGDPVPELLALRQAVSGALTSWSRMGCQTLVTDPDRHNCRRRKCRVTPAVWTCRLTFNRSYCRFDHLDTRTPDDDRSGDLLAERIAEDGHVLASRMIVTDDVDRITARLQDWIEDPQIDVIVTTGGTGLTGRDSTPKPLTELSKRPFRDLASCFASFPMKRSAPPPFVRAVAGVAGGTICSPCPARRPAAAMAGIFCAISSIFAIAHATSWKSCLA